MSHFNCEKWDTNRYIKSHIKNILMYIDLILNNFLPKYDLRNKKNNLVYQSFQDSILINIYWLAEAKNIKNIKSNKNCNNPFYIWCKFFDSLKHPERQIEIANKMIEIIENNLTLSQSGAPIPINLDKFVDGLKANNEKKLINNNDFYKLYIKFVHPMFLETNSLKDFGIEDEYTLTKKYCIIFWKTLKDFFTYLVFHTEKDWKNIWNEFEQSNTCKKDIKAVWDFYFKLFNI